MCFGTNSLALVGNGKGKCTVVVEKLACIGFLLHSSKLWRWRLLPSVVKITSFIFAYWKSSFFDTSIATWVLAPKCTHGAYSAITFVGRHVHRS